MKSPASSEDTIDRTTRRDYADPPEGACPLAYPGPDYEAASPSAQPPAASFAGDAEGSKNLVPVWSILPSYHMYRSTVSQSMNVSYDEYNDTVYEPPTYHESERRASEPLQAMYSTDSEARDGSSGSNSVERPSYIVADDSNSSQWQNTILANVHKLKNLSDSHTNEFAKNIKFSVHFTEEVGKAGVAPKVIDISNYEYKQGDLIHGYILIENTSGQDIPFDAFYVVLEGNFTIGSMQTDDFGKPVTSYTKKFLEMFDFSASWQYGYLTRLAEDNGEHISTIIDPLDNTCLPFGSGNQRIIRGDYVHKRFFTFKLPEKLLDSSCEHSLIKHTELPSSLGLTKAEKLYYLKNPTQHKRKVRDFSFIDSSISYTVSARFIGKASMYGEKKAGEGGIVSSTGDEYLILKDNQQHLRIISQTLKKHKTLAEKTEKLRQDRILYRNLLSRLDSHIELAEGILKVNLESNPEENSELVNVRSPSLAARSLSRAGSFSTRENEQMIKSIADDLAKCRQMYVPKKLPKNVQASADMEDYLESYKVFFPFQKRSLTSSSKLFGTIVISSPYKPYEIEYVEPPRFREGKNCDPESWRFQIPIDLEFVLSSSILESSNPKKVQHPELKKISVELVALTIKTEKAGAIPIEINNGFLFETAKEYVKTCKSAPDYDTDYLEELVVKPVRTRMAKIQDLARRLGSDGFRMDAKLAEDVNCLCTLETKSNTLVLDDYILKTDNNKVTNTSGLSKLPWEVKKGLPVASTYTKSFTIDVDLTTAKLKSPDKQFGKAYDNFCLVPNFQMCNMARFYYLRVLITLQNGDVMFINFPVEIIK